MFEVPGAKRVKRSKLFSSFSSPSASEDEPDLQSPKEQQPLQNSSEVSERSGYGSVSPHGAGSRHESTLEDEDGRQSEEINYGFEYEFIDKISPSKYHLSGDKKHEKHNNTDLSENTTSTEAAQDAKESTAVEPEEETFEFHLFKPSLQKSTSTTLAATPTAHGPQATQVATRITIRSPTPDSTIQNDPSRGRMVKPRPHSHYFTSFATPTTQQEREIQYRTAALSGTQIKLLSKHSWPGTHLPWRVISVPRSKLIASASTLAPVSLSSPPATGTQQRERDMLRPTMSDPLMAKRTRPSKKKRIHVRTLRNARKTAQMEADQRGKVDEEAERERRTRRNREKKVKRKEREKEKKKKVADAGNADVVNDDATTAVAGISVDTGADPENNKA